MIDTTFDGASRLFGPTGVSLATGSSAIMATAAADVLIVYRAGYA